MSSGTCNCLLKLPAPSLFTEASTRLLLLSQSMLKVWLGVNPVPVTVTEAPADPAGGFRLMLGLGLAATSANHSAASGSAGRNFMGAGGMLAGSGGNLDFLRVQMGGQGTDQADPGSGYRQPGRRAASTRRLSADSSARLMSSRSSPPRSSCSRS